MAYCGRCNQEYDCHYTVHDDECPGFEQTTRKHLTEQELDAIDRATLLLKMANLANLVKKRLESVNKENYMSNIVPVIIAGIFSLIEKEMDLIEVLKQEEVTPEQSAELNAKINATTARLQALAAKPPTEPENPGQ